MKKKKKTVTTKKKHKKFKGFTLIELLAVIIILGVLMIIAIPSVTEYIQSSRKNAYVTTAGQLVSGARNKINAAEIPMYDIEATYYVPTSCINLEKGGGSPFGEIEEGYIVVTYDGFGYDYYFTVRDSAGMGILLTSENLLENKKVSTGVTSLDTTIAIEGKEKILVVEDCKSQTIEKEATATIPPKGEHKDVEKIETVTRTTPYWGNIYSCVLKRDSSQSMKIAFYSDGYTGLLYDDGSIYLSTGATISYIDNKIVDRSDPSYELAEISNNGKKIYMYDTVDIPEADCTLDKNSIYLNVEYTGTMDEKSVSVIFYEDGKADVKLGENSTTMPIHSFMYTSNQLYNFSENKAYTVLDNGNKIDVEGTIITAQK